MPAADEPLTADPVRQGNGHQLAPRNVHRKLQPVTDPEDHETSEQTPDEDDDYYYDDYEPRRQRRRLLLAMAAAVLVVAGLGVGLGLTLTGSSSTQHGPEGVPIQHAPDLASADSTVSGAPVGGITCRKTMQQNAAYHIHVHLDIFVNGRQERIPAGAGIVPPRSYQQISGGQFVDSSFPNGCLYWLHVHAADGIIHVESPTTHTFLLGQFFDIWGQPLGPNQVGPATGPVVAFENGERFAGNPRDIPLLTQAVVQLDVGNPVVAFKPMTFHVIGLCSLSCSATPTS
jgi:hypothetical protein